MGIAAIRDGLEMRLETIGGLRIYHEMPALIASTPAILVKPEAGEYDFEMGGSKISHVFVLTLLVSLGQGHERAQAELDAYLAPTGANSIKAAIEAEQTLGGACDDLRVRRYYDYTGHIYAGTQYLGVKLECEVWG